MDKEGVGAKKEKEKKNGVLHGAACALLWCECGSFPFLATFFKIGGTPFVTKL